MPRGRGVRGAVRLGFRFNWACYHPRDERRETAPTHIVHELTALPKAGPRRPVDLEPTNRLRDEGTRNQPSACDP